MLFKDLYFIGDENFEAKFIRINNDFYIGEPGDLITGYYEMAEKEKIVDKIRLAEEANKEEVDGGLIFVIGRVIRIGSQAEELDLPKNDQARKLTIRRMKQIHPEFMIKEVSDD
jgi:hypothetical protein